MRGYKDALLDVQARHVRVHDESIMGIHKAYSWERIQSSLILTG